MGTEFGVALRWRLGERLPGLTETNIYVNDTPALGLAFLYCT